MRKYFFIFETLIGLAVLVAVNMAFLNNSIAFQNIHPHPYWIVILLIASRYGTLQGVIAGGLAAVTFIALGSTSGHIDFSHDAFPHGAFKYPFLFLLVGGVLGEIRSNYKKKYQRLEKKHNELREDLHDLETLHGAMTESKEELEKRIAFQSSTTLNLIERFNSMQTLELDELYVKCLKLLEEHLNVTSSSIYLIQNNRLELFARRSKTEDSTLPDSVELTYGMMGEVVTGKKVVTINRSNGVEMSQFDRSDLIMSAPIKRKDDAILGVINIESIPFFDFTTNTVRIFEMLSHWISSLVDKAIQFKKLKDRNIADEITGAYNYFYFEKRLTYEVARAKRFNTALSLVLLQVQKFNEMDEGERRNVLLVLNGLFKNILRQTDIISKYRDDDIFAIILPCQTSAAAEKIMKRLMGEITDFQVKPFEGRDEVLSLKYGLSSLQIKEGSHETLVQTAEERLHLSGQQRASDIFADIKYLLGPNDDEVNESKVKPIRGIANPERA